MLRRRVIAIGAAAAVSVAGGAIAAGPVIPVGDRHQMIAAQDADRDFLADREEQAIGYQPFRADQNGNAFPDGIELAAYCADAISRLPNQASASDPGRTYKNEMLLLGSELCEVCGESINMGTVEVVNPELGLRVELPIIAVHFMEHGSFSYAGELHKGRSNVPVLLRTLGIRFPVEMDEHQLPLDYSTDKDPEAPGVNDLDGDRLTDEEELATGLNLYQADQNENLLPDGMELAQRFAEQIDRLPTFDPDQPEAKGLYKVSYMMRGLEWCGICGQSVNMGFWQIVDSASGMTIDVPVIAWHYMQHGSFSFHGSVHGVDRIDVVALDQILGRPTRCGDLGTLNLPGDLNGDCRVDFRDLAQMAGRWIDSTDPAIEPPDQK